MKWNWKSVVSVGLALVIGIAVAGWSTAPNGSASKHSHGITVLAVGAGDVSAAAGSGLLEPSALLWCPRSVGREASRTRGQLGEETLQHLVDWV